jgi:hypothetical protein
VKSDHGSEYAFEDVLREVVERTRQQYGCGDEDPALARTLAAVWTGRVRREQRLDAGRQARVDQ